MNFDAPLMVETSSGIRLASYSEGSSGPPVIFCHGFPELAFTWRHVMPAVVAAGYRAVAFDMPGYGRSDRPEPVEAYDIVALTSSIGDAVRALGFEKAVFVGHDWGASVIWEMPLLEAPVVAGVVGVNTPRWKYRNWGRTPLVHLKDVFGPDHYMLFFQRPGDAEGRMVADGKYEAAADRRHRRPPFHIFPVDPESGLARQHLASLRGAPLGEPLLSEEEASYYGSAFRNTGFTGGLNWYRNIERNAELLHGTSMSINVPALMIAATHDIYNPEQASSGIEALGPRFERIVLPRSGHWLPDENRADLNTGIIDWLRRHDEALWS